MRKYQQDINQMQQTFAYQQQAQQQLVQQYAGQQQRVTRTDLAPTFEAPPIQLGDYYERQNSPDNRSK